ncbi:MAG: hypothetical protein EOS07_21790 [Mesorhizobium sp.]|uniref:hypothetical protein n=1 Tax=Mesorhizobium sp. TaxID=1871066 RepID=UPI000FE569A3|nr:hypothetical protein [Mesorhizobium sp.]RWO06275.1 MAG: hypothetical protein EOS07_21790 [Mesorhizobium sp.]RWP29851.1 MAG: hypothetical protein EOR03_25670 [Mesorhizobium sp.]RWP69582.1 MAG: hypothetical protein EOR07_03390 [Mesorhizobium sp.]
MNPISEAPRDGTVFLLHGDSVHPSGVWAFFAGDKLYSLDFEGEAPSRGFWCHGAMRGLSFSDASIEFKVVQK